jgi:hypothetical protein
MVSRVSSAAIGSSPMTPILSGLSGPAKARAGHAT